MISSLFLTAYENFSTMNDDCQPITPGHIAHNTSQSNTGVAGPSSSETPENRPTLTVAGNLNQQRTNQQPRSQGFVALQKTDIFFFNLCIHIY